MKVNKSFGWQQTHELRQALVLEAKNEAYSQTTTTLLYDTEIITRHGRQILWFVNISVNVSDFS